MINLYYEIRIYQKIYNRVTMTLYVKGVVWFNVNKTLLLLPQICRNHPKVIQLLGHELYWNMCNKLQILDLWEFVNDNSVTTIVTITVTTLWKNHCVKTTVTNTNDTFETMRILVTEYFFKLFLEVSYL